MNPAVTSWVIYFSLFGFEEPLYWCPSSVPLSLHSPLSISLSLTLRSVVLRFCVYSRLTWENSKERGLEHIKNFSESAFLSQMCVLVILVPPTLRSSVPTLCWDQWPGRTIDAAWDVTRNVGFRIRTCTHLRANIQVNGKSWSPPWQLSGISEMVEYSLAWALSGGISWPWLTWE